jgi:hypothetical protein
MALLPRSTIHDRRRSDHAPFTESRDLDASHNRRTTPFSASLEEGAMKSTDNRVIRLDLTQAQKAQVEQATGKQAEALELSVQELEERIAPSIMGSIGK